MLRSRLSRLESIFERLLKRLPTEAQSIQARGLGCVLHCCCGRVSAQKMPHYGKRPAVAYNPLLKRLSA